MERLTLNIDINKGIKVKLYVKNPVFNAYTHYNATVYANKLIAESIADSDKISIYFKREYNRNHILYFLVQTVDREEYKIIMDKFIKGMVFPVIIEEREFNNITVYFRMKLIVDNGICY